MTKAQLREKFLGKRKELSFEKKRDMELEIESRLLMSEPYRACDTVLTYVSTKDEVDTLGIIRAAFANKKRVAVPKTNDDFSLSFYYINSLKELKLGRFNIPEPPKTACKVENFENSICVIPALCCDLAGNRIGYGKGCYDRFLKNYNGEKICLIYSDNILTSIENDSTDVKVDMIVSNLYVKNT